MSRHEYVTLESILVNISHRVSRASRKVWHSPLSLMKKIQANKWLLSLSVPSDEVLKSSYSMLDMVLYALLGALCFIIL